MAPSPFEILGLDDNSTPAEARRAYLELMNYYSPRRNTTAQAGWMRIRINQAYRQIASQDAAKAKAYSPSSQWQSRIDSPCRRKRRGCRSHRRFGWQLPEEFIGTEVYEKS